MLTLDQIITEIRTIAAESPDFVYEKPEGEASCLYVHTEVLTDEVIEGEGCIVGRALTRLGVETDYLLDNNASLADHVIHGLESNEVVETLTESNHHKVQWIAQAQCAQDMGESWSEAVASADEAYARVLV